MSNQKDKDEAKERVWNEFLTLPYGDGIGSSYKQAMNMAFEAGIAYHAAAELRWIPVSERLPEVGQDVNFIVGGIPEKSPYAYENGRKLGGRYTSDGSFSVPGSAYPATHWMPMLDTEPADNIGDELHVIDYATGHCNLGCCKGEV